MSFRDLSPCPQLSLKTGVTNTCHHALLSMWVLGIQTQVLRLYQESLVPRPFVFFWIFPILGIDPGALCMLSKRSLYQWAVSQPHCLFCANME